MTDVDTSPSDSPADDQGRSAAHPWRWMAAASSSSWSGCSSMVRPPTTRTGGTFSEVPVRQRILRGVVEHLAADRALDGAGDRARHDAGGDAAVAEPGVALGGLGVSVDIPWHTDLRAVGVLGTVPVDLPEHSSGVPFGPSFLQLNLQALSIPFLLAVIGLALNEAAYMAEIIRAGISSVPRDSARRRRRWACRGG